MAEIDPYAVLGVTRTATREEIARAYRMLAKQHHPDAGASPSPTMARVNEAWSILGSATRRERWDRDHAVVRAPHWAATPPHPRARPEPRAAPPPPSRMDSGWIAFGVVAVVAALVGVSMIGLSSLTAPAAPIERFEDEALRFDYPDDWVAAPGDGSDGGAHRVVAHLVTFGTGDDRLCTTLSESCSLAPEEIPAGEASIVITSWEGGTPPVPEPIVSRPAGLDADAIIGGRPAAFDRRDVDEDTTRFWWQLSPPGFPDRWIEVTALIRGAVLEQTGVLADIEELLSTVEFRD